LFVDITEVEVKIMCFPCMSGTYVGEDVMWLYSYLDLALVDFSFMPLYSQGKDSHYTFSRTRVDQRASVDVRKERKIQLRIVHPIAWLLYLLHDPSSQ
jgi:hypothetical protein